MEIGGICIIGLGEWTPLVALYIRDKCNRKLILPRERLQRESK